MVREMLWSQGLPGKVSVIRVADETYNVLDLKGLGFSFFRDLDVKFEVIVIRFRV